MVVTVRELFSQELPALPCSPSLSAEDAEVALSFLAAGASRAPLGAAILGALPERPPLGPRGGPTPISRAELEARHAAVRDARERTCDHLRLALQRRAASRQSSGRSTSLGTSRAETSRAESSCADFVPAIFPFPEPIPQGPPERCTSSMAQVAPLPEGHIPAVFPFPEPIPQGPPPRAASVAANTAASSRSCSRGDSRRAPLPSAFGGSSQRSGFVCKKEEVDDGEFLRQNKKRANAWLSHYTPKIWQMEHERPHFIRAKLDEERRRKRMAEMYRNMPTLPFDAWCVVRRAEIAEQLAEVSGSGRRMS